eukprot:CAMPEP_0113944166 /NCGR_PEP_ID=MMETSP1339-20121228/30680_1 /TAXON_ID=94617 /ORGANISM="Fibrocapsa japonica" /LENGTH=254 /DNA_ID=CAMNT_0000949253 /DNA_START=16 /DNA_END=780 /DNA_ORIENTATION=- /assembly_acc=CAM_ASM_000762
MKPIISFVALALVSILPCEGFLSSPHYASSNAPATVLLSQDQSTVSSSSTTSIALTEIAKDFIYSKTGFYSSYDADAFSDEFIFRGPFIGPLNKKDYFQTMDAFEIYKAIPDINPNAWGFSIDPNDPNRVWLMVRNTGTFTGQPILPNAMNLKPNGAKLQGCPETFSIIFDEEQKVKYLSVGYVADRFEGNTGGKGAAVGIFNAVGLPFPKVGPVQRFAQWFGTEVFKFGPLSYSVKDVPKWWKDKTVGSEGFL